MLRSHEMNWSTFQMNDEKISFSGGIRVFVPPGLNGALPGVTNMQLRFSLLFVHVARGLTLTLKACRTNQHRLASTLCSSLPAKLGFFQTHSFSNVPVAPLWYLPADVIHQWHHLKCVLHMYERTLRVILSVVMKCLVLAALLGYFMNGTKNPWGRSEGKRRGNGRQTESEMRNSGLVFISVALSQPVN